MSEPKFLTTPQFAAARGVSHWHACRMLRENPGFAIRTGNFKNSHFRVPVEHMDKLNAGLSMSQIAEEARRNGAASGQR